VLFVFFFLYKKKRGGGFFYFICQSGYSQSDPDSAYAALNRFF